MTKPIVVQTTKQADRYPKGAELGFESVAKAEKVLGDDAFKVVRYQSGEPYEAPKSTSRKTADTSDSASKNA